MKTETELRAAEARQLLDNPLLIEAFASVREGLIEAIEVCPLTEDRFRDKLMLSLQILRRLRADIEDHIVSGKLSKRTLEEY